MTATLRHQHPPAAARGRLLLWLAALVLMLQLFAAVGHDHELESRAQDCVACSVQAQSHAAPPAPPVGPGVFVAVLTHIVTSGPPVEAATHPAIRLLPQAHAPPALPIAS